MSLNHLMHPRNIYTKPPDFKSLSLNDPEFAKYCHLGLNGKVLFDFTSEEGLRYLTTTLLKKDFNLDVYIPPDKLVPTLTLRLNYILWIEDLLQGIEDKDDEYIAGIDIGTGASCIFPLLAAKKNSWKMLATEINECSIEIARENIRKNNMQDMIVLKHVSNDTFLINGIDAEKKYDFCMANPPFYSNDEELEKSTSSRSSDRKPPNNCRTGMADEVIVPGGEIEFIKNIIKDSLQLKNQIRIYTTMMGHKSSLKTLEKELQNLDGCSVAKAQFFQGRTLRWGLAWTFDPSVKLCNFLPTVDKQKEKPSKPGKPLKFVIMAQCDFEECVNKVDTILNKLKIQYSSRRNLSKNHTWKIIAYENTWSNQRQKRRLEKRLQNVVGEYTESPKTNIEDRTIENSDAMDIGDDNEVESKVGNETRVEDNHETEGNGNIDKSESSNKRPLEIEEEDDKAVKCFKRSPNNEEKEKGKKKPIIVKAHLLLTSNSDNRFLLQITPLTENKEAVHQILQYFQNNFLRSH